MLVDPTSDGWCDELAEERVQAIAKKYASEIVAPPL
jgi:hypothetical protein